MLIFILFAICLAKVKGYQVRSIFKCFDLFPLMLTEVVYLFFVINAYVGNYSFVAFAKQIQICFLLSMIFPILKRNLYIEGITGSLMVMIGTVLNHVVIRANDGRMPVYPTLSKLTGYYRNDLLSQGIDSLHMEMSAATKMNLLGDYIDIGFSIMSIGDIMIHSFIVVIVYTVLKRNTMKVNSKENK